MLPVNSDEVVRREQTFTETIARAYPAPPPPNRSENQELACFTFGKEKIILQNKNVFLNFQVCRRL